MDMECKYSLGIEALDSRRRVVPSPEFELVNDCKSSDYHRRRHLWNIPPRQAGSHRPFLFLRCLLNYEISFEHRPLRLQEVHV